MISIVVPARNEAAVIARNLQAMVAGAAPGELEIVVVCNACSDDTADVARRAGPPVRVVETEKAGKPHALNLGDRNAGGFPRIYVDADVVVPIAVIRALAKRLSRGDVLAAAPLGDVNLSGTSWPVRAYYDIARRLPAAHQGFGGSGVYAVSEAGRARFGEFPEIAGDDTYVRIQFKPNERDTIAATSTVFPPRTLRDLVTIKVRSQYGNFELARLYPQLWANMGESNHKALAGLLKNPMLWPQLFVYLLVTLLARSRARNRQRTNTFTWDRDDTSRAPTGR